MQLMAVAAEYFGSSDSFSVTLKAISAGKASISLSARMVLFTVPEEWDSMAGSSTSVTVKNEAAGSNTGNNNNTGSLIRIWQLYPQIIP